MQIVHAIQEDSSCESCMQIRNTIKNAVQANSIKKAGPTLSL